MTTFTQTQVQQLIKAQNFNGTVEDYCAQNNISVKIPKANSRATLQGKTCIVVLSSSTTGEFLFTTNKGFAGRTAEWVINDWKKTVKNSRQYMQALVNAEDVTVYSSEPLACVSEAEIGELNVQTANVLAEYLNNGYTCLTKIPTAVQVLLEGLVQTSAEDAHEAQDTAEQQEPEAIEEIATEQQETAVEQQTTKRSRTKKA